MIFLVTYRSWDETSYCIRVEAPQANDAVSQTRSHPDVARVTDVQPELSPAQAIGQRADQKFDNLSQSQ